MVWSTNCDRRRFCLPRLRARTALRLTSAAELCCGQFLGNSEAREKMGGLLWKVANFANDAGMLLPAVFARQYAPRKYLPARIWIDAFDGPGLLDTCWRHGTEDPHRFLPRNLSFYEMLDRTLTAHLIRQAQIPVSISGIGRFEAETMLTTSCRRYREDSEVCPGVFSNRRRNCNGEHESSDL